MEEIEIERTFLVKSLPKDLEMFPYKVLYDIYLPTDSPHAILRLRQNGDTYEITKKFAVDAADHSEHTEMTIPLDKEEFTELATVPGKRVRKKRYLYAYKGMTAEIDVFHDSLKGLVLADFEFKTSEQKNTFVIPEWCLVEVTQEEFLAGGALSGKSYGDIEEQLLKFGYEKIKG